MYYLTMRNGHHTNRTDTMDNIDLTELTPDAVGRVYSGKPGCGCGCRGKYYDDARNIKRVVNLIRARADADWRRVGINEMSDDPNFSAVAFVEDDTRYLWAYLK